MRTQTDEMKKPVGRPKKAESVYRVKNNSMDSWTPETEMKKQRGRPPKEAVSAPEGIIVPFDLDPSVKKHYILLANELQALDVDLVTYHRVHLLLAKQYAFEDLCERELKKIGGIAYKTAGESIGYREHPAAKHLQMVRGKILDLLKSLCLTPSSRAGARFEKETETNGFASLQ